MTIVGCGRAAGRRAGLGGGGGAGGVTATLMGAAAAALSPAGWSAGSARYLVADGVETSGCHRYAAASADPVSVPARTTNRRARMPAIVTGLADGIPVLYSRDGDSCSLGVHHHHVAPGTLGLVEAHVGARKELVGSLGRRVV